MIYIVSGDGPRCGSTMMMRALEAGGLELSWDATCNEEVGDEICELPLTVQLSEGFPGPEYVGKILKVWCPPWGPLTCLVKGEYKVIWLTRSEGSRWKSVIAFHSQSPLGMMVDGAFTEVARLKDMAVQAGKFAVQHRVDMEVSEVAYEDVLKEPLAVFKELAQIGWPIDPVKASKVVDPSRRNF
ncbi:MAG TPA: hypothetical protein ENH62_02305 [Marinobacter sp.]|uniref:Uncharacterized protein n=1 Tax=marine sediment metagenome TaxID=412755 RepID=A0A0F9PBN1_9ZZZZ|nr:hypothetical protein [Marinobacter sp.]